MRTDVAVHTSAETLTAQSLLLLGRHTASPQSSPHSSVRQWLQTFATAVAPPSPAESLSPSSSELQQAFPSGTNAAMMAPPTVLSSRALRSTRHSRRSAASSLAAELREMSGHFMHMMG